MSNEIPAQAVLSIAKLQNGKVVFNLEGQLNRQVFNEMIETARQDILQLLFEKEREMKKGGGVAVPPPGFRPPNPDIFRNGSS